MTKKSKSIYDSGTTKGSAPRTSDYKKYSDNYDKIFKKKDKNEDKKNSKVVSINQGLDVFLPPEK